jgi:hypothetical protein
MTDEDLRSARAAWEAERANRWAQVTALSGAAYGAAYEEYMKAKAEADAVAEEARRRGVRRRRSGAAVAPQSTAGQEFRFEVSTTAGHVTAVADGAVRFPERERTALRNELRVAVGQIPVAPGHLLRGTFRGELSRTWKTDVENRVLLNIGLAERSLRRGFAFEQDTRRPAGWTCGYDYCAVSTADPFDHWRPGQLLTSWDDVALEHGLSATAIWWALRARRPTTPVGPEAAVPATLLTATVVSPRPLTLNQLKAIADGAVAAAQWTARVNPVAAAHVAGNLARTGVQVDRDLVAELLQDPAGAGAGLCQDGLIAKDGRVDPDDHLLAAGAISVELGAASKPSVSAALFVAQPRAVE